MLQNDCKIKFFNKVVSSQNLFTHDKMYIPLSETSKAPVDMSCPSTMFVTKNMRMQAYIWVKSKMIPHLKD